MDELRKQLTSLLERIDEAMRLLNIEEDERQLAQLQAQQQLPDFWDDPQVAAGVSRQASALEHHVVDWQQLRRETADNLELANLGDGQLLEEIQATYSRLLEAYTKREFELKLSGPYDKGSAIVSVYAGTGGTDAQDWSEMLERMYLRYAEANGFEATILDLSPGEEAGIKSVTFEVNGPYAYGRLKGEKGVHRLVRLSPFNADNLRQTSFALIDVMPQLETPEELELDSKDLRIDVFRSSGHGGQSVNTTDSAVRITHVPTGIVVAIQNERSQLQNKEKAMTLLRARLAALMLEQHQEKVSELRGPNQSAEWGNQIRSYVLHPYTKVKDHRTGYESSQASDVLDGALEPYIEAYLQSQIGAK